MSVLSRPIYLDNHATTKVDPRVVEAMLPYFSEAYGNASSRQHAYGWEAEGSVEASREHVARLIGASAREIIFTSGATESVNLALKGTAEASLHRGNHIVTAVTEHAAVLDSCAALERAGFEVTYLPVDEQGVVAPHLLERALRQSTILVSVMLANNEIGTIAPLEQIGRICRERGVLLHSDATQAVAKIPVDVSALPVDLLSFSAHKMYGPKGIGALYVRTARPAIALAAQMHGGGHEHGLRSGTLNVPAIVGFGAAAEIATHEMEAEARASRRLRDRLVETLLRDLPGAHLNGHPVLRLPNNANITFPGVSADAVMMAVKDVALSSGSACSTAVPAPSHVLRAIGLSDDEARSSLRFGLGRFTTGAEIDYAVKRITEVVRALRTHQESDIQTHSLLQ